MNQEFNFKMDEYRTTDDMYYFKKPEKFIINSNREKKDMLTSLYCPEKWKHKYFEELELDENILSWGFMTHQIMYKTKNSEEKMYYPDIWFCHHYKDEYNFIQETLVELDYVSTENQGMLTQQELDSLSPSIKQDYLLEQSYYDDVVAKYTAAKEYCKKRNILFVLLTPDGYKKYDTPNEKEIH